MEISPTVTGLMVTAALAGAVAIATTIAPLNDREVNPPSVWEAGHWDWKAPTQP
jgi:hypothetical protein